MYAHVDSGARPGIVATPLQLLQSITGLVGAAFFRRLFPALGIICFQKNLDTFSFLFPTGPGYTLSTA